MQKKELCFIVQGNYGYGWEDLTAHGCGIRQKDYCEAIKGARQDLKDYNMNESYAHRIIERYEEILN